MALPNTQPSFDAPIPGQSMVSELGARPWQQPSQYTTIEEAVDAHDHAAIEAGCPTSSVNFKKNIPMNYQPKKKLRKNNTSNCTGVNKKRNGTYQVQIRMNYRSLVWTFDNYADAQRQAANVIRKQEDLKQQNQEPAYTYFDNKKILKKRKK